MGKPAARVTDMHTCPLVSPGPVPHVGGPILPPCVPTVLIGMLPAATITDKCVCVGPLDFIAGGSPTVFIGGRMAARMGDPTSHGGVIVMGCPTVLIGETGSGGAGGGGGAAPSAIVPGSWFDDLLDWGKDVLEDLLGRETYCDGIVIEGDKAYRDTVRQQLDLMATTVEGKKLLEALKGAGGTVTIHADNPPPNPPNAFAGPGKSTDQDFADATPKGTPVFDGAGNPINGSDGKQLIGTGKGGDSDVTYNPEQWTPGATTSGAPGDVILFHELTHSNNQMRGEYDGTPRTDNFDTNEEFNTIGPENRYRDERGVAKRTDHHDL